jgi:ADP-heptose:LPS heptosyltransferase
MKFLIIQTAFAGDVILATGIIEKLRQFYPQAQIDFLLRKGNESLLQGHPHLSRLMIWDKNSNKLGNLVKIAWEVRRSKYDHVINLHRFSSSGFITALSGAKRTSGFSKNPFAFTFSDSLPHNIGDGTHETERNHSLIAGITDDTAAKPRLYPPAEAFEKVKQFKSGAYICIAPASVWFTKQYPKEKWADLLNRLPAGPVYLLGAGSDRALCEELVSLSRRPGLLNLAGDLSFPETAALMKDAGMNYANDSSPLHVASAMNANITAVFCSTVPAFGFGPLSVNSHIAEIRTLLECRPCGLHGYKACPLGHFRCAWEINTEDLLF